MRVVLQLSRTHHRGEYAPRRVLSSHDGDLLNADVL